MAKQTLTTEARLELQFSLQRSFSETQGPLTARMDSVKIWRDQYEGILPNKPDKWSSNANISTTKAMIDSACDSIATTICNAEPAFQVETVDLDDVEQSKDMSATREKWLELWVDRTKTRSKMETAIKQAGIDGEAWVVASAKTTGVPVQKNYTKQLSVRDLPGEPITDYVLTEDMALMPYNARNFAQAQGAFRRRWFRWSDIKNGNFIPGAVAELKEQWESDNPSTFIEDQHDIQSQTAATLWEAKWECWEGIYRWTQPGTEVEREWFVICAHKIDTGGAVTVLDCRDFRQTRGKEAVWPFFLIRCEPIPNSMHGRSFCESIRGLQNFMNAMFNGIADGVSLSIQRPILLGSGASHLQKAKFFPGAKWICSNPATDISIMDSVGDMQAASLGMAQMEFARETAERVLGVSDMMQGKPSAEKRTAFEISAVVEGGNVKFERMVARIEFGVDETQGLDSFAAELMRLTDLVTPDVPISFKRRGDKKMSVFEPGIKDGRFEYIPHGTNSNVNPESRYKRAYGTIQEMKACPFAQISLLDDADDVLAKMQNWHRAYSRFWVAMGNKNVEELIRSEPETIDEAIKLLPVFMDPQMALEIIKRIEIETGKRPPPVPGVPEMGDGTVPVEGLGAAPGTDTGLGGQPGGGGLPFANPTPGMAQV